MNSLWKSPFWNFQVTDFCNILRHIVKSKVIQTFTKLLKSGSVNKNDLINSVYMWLNSSILFSHVFLKSRRDCRLKSLFICIVFLCSFFYSLFKHRSIYIEIKLCHEIEVFTPEHLNANNILHEAFLNPQYTVFTISKLKQINNKSFYCLLIILSGDISLNLGPVSKHQILNTTEWNIFKTKDLHLMDLNINSLLPKIDELRHMARLSNAAVIGICESKLDKSITNSEILIDNYDLLRCDRNRNGGGVACYIRNNLSHTQNNLFPNDIENVFFKVHLPKAKPITVGIVYRPPNQTNFIKTLNENFAKLDTTNKETYILGDFNINLYHNGKYIICKNNTLISRSVTNDARNSSVLHNIWLKTNNKISDKYNVQKYIFN